VDRLEGLLGRKTLEVSFFKGALQKVEARRQKKGPAGEPGSTTMLHAFSRRVVGWALAPHLPVLTPVGELTTPVAHTKVPASTDRLAGLRIEFEEVRNQRIASPSAPYASMGAKGTGERDRRNEPLFASLLPHRFRLRADFGTLAAKPGCRAVSGSEPSRHS